MRLLADRRYSLTGWMLEEMTDIIASDVHPVARHKLLRDMNLNLALEQLGLTDQQ